MGEDSQKKNSCRGGGVKAPVDVVVQVQGKKESPVKGKERPTGEGKGEDAAFPQKRGKGQAQDNTSRKKSFDAAAAKRGGT